VLEDDLPTELMRRRQARLVLIERRGEQHVAENFLHRLRHLALLWQRAVVLDGQDHRISTQGRRRLEWGRMSKCIAMF
jgi:hypothetical protein